MSNQDGRWSLDVLYKGLDDPAFKADKDAILKLQDELVTLCGEKQGRELVLAYVPLMEKFSELLSKVFSFLSLQSAADTTDMAVLSETNRLYMALTAVEKCEVVAGRELAELKDFDDLLKEEALKDYTFMLTQKREDAKHRLSPELEELAYKLNISGGSAWENLYEALTSTLKVPYKGEVLNLSAIRNKASDPDPEVRKSAYEAELAAYPQAELSVATALNSIKSQVKLMAKERGFKSPLDEALHKSSMKRETLDALIGAMQDHLDVFRRYLKAKAKLLGETGGLSWYNLFAPLGSLSKTYTVEEAHRYLVDTFMPVNPKIAGLMDRAFKEQWIDFYPRAGKVGGAFCHNLQAVKQSRILTNFDGSFNDVDTLAHELGHAFHGLMTEEHKPLNRDYSMPVAETASTFNETHLIVNALNAAANEEEELALLESILMNTTQTIVDIYSRYLFETSVFELCDQEFMDAEKLCSLMLEAQKKAYGDGLKPEVMHPYMWLCKGHYYSTGLSFYNFPYAFGALLSMGLYNRYLEEGPTYMEKYERFLKLTTVTTVEDCAAAIGIDLTKKDFWVEGLTAFGKLVDRFCELAKY